MVFTYNLNKRGYSRFSGSSFGNFIPGIMTVCRPSNITQESRGSPLSQNASLLSGSTQYDPVIIANDADAFGRQVLFAQNSPPACRHLLHLAQGIPFSHFSFNLALAEMAKRNKRANVAQVANFMVNGKSLYLFYNFSFEIRFIV